MRQTPPRDVRDRPEPWVLLEPGVWSRAERIDGERAAELMTSRLEVVSARRIDDPQDGGTH